MSLPLNAVIFPTTVGRAMPPPAGRPCALLL
jgi:hypothetical protein